MQTGISKKIVKFAREIECKRCKYKWFYMGANQSFCSCPSCRTTVTINFKRRIAISKATLQTGHDANRQARDNDRSAIPRPRTAALTVGENDTGYG